MKKILDTLYSIGLIIGQAKAATALARAGMYKEAQALYNK